MSLSIKDSQDGGTETAEQSLPLSQASTQDLNQDAGGNGSQPGSTRKRKRASKVKKQEVPSSTAGTDGPSQSQLVVGPPRPGALSKFTIHILTI